MSESPNMEAIAGQLQTPIFTDSSRLIIHDQSVPVVLTPPGWKTSELEHLLPAPTSIKERASLHDIESLVAYTKEFQGEEDSVRYFANEANKTIVAVLDPHTHENPSHQSHTAVLSLDSAPEWDTWKNFCGQYRPRKEFIRFVENHLENITGDFSGAKILEMCRDLKATNTNEIAINEDLEGGKRKLSFQNTKHVSSNDQKSVIFPEHLEISLRVFKGDNLFNFKARLRWDLEGSELFFAIDLKESKIVEEQAFTDIVEKVAGISDQTILRGSYS